MVFIHNPIQFSDDEQQTIDGNPPNEPKDWNKQIFESIRNRIREELFQEQNETCPYCNFEIRDCGHTPEIEHIVPKKLHLNFMFESRNLCVACRTCNVSKSKKETLVDPNVAIYPTSGNDFIIVHPHFDNWDDHLELEYDLFIIPKNNSNKGNDTITFCKLNRENLYENRAKELIKIGETAVKQIVLELIQKKDPRITDRLTRIIERA